MTTNTEPSPNLRYSLRTLFAITTTLALFVCFVVWLYQAQRQSSPDNPAYWLDQFHNGTPQERETALHVIVGFVKPGQVNQAIIDALCEAATDKNVKKRSTAVLGLDKLKSNNSRAKSVLERLAKDDPDPDVRSMAQQALDVGISSNP